MNWYKLLFWLAVIVIVIMFFRSCSCGGGNDTTTVITIDSVRVEKDTTYIPHIVTITRNNVTTKWRTDTLTEYDVRIDPVDTAAILQQYYQVVEYEDVQPIQYGTVTISDTVSQNRITGRRLQISQTIPEINRTVTMEKHNVVGYIGASLIWASKEPFYAIGADFSLKLKNDRMYSLGVQYGRDNVLYYMGGVKLPVRLKK